MAKKVGRRTISSLKKKAWNLCSKYIRQKYATFNGYVTCYTCGIIKHWKQMQAGHGFSGRGNSILFEEDIIRPQCFKCNCYQGGKLHIFTYKLRKELGDERFERLYQKQFKSHQFTVEELEDIITNYKHKGGYH